MDIPFEDFKKLDIRVGEIKNVEDIEGSRNLVKLIVDFGGEERQAVAGIKNYYSKEELVGNKFIFILNLERRNLMGIESQCMILAADDEKGNVVLLRPEKDIEAGAKIR
ncbi:MAG: methionine--tRNA ligase subunit beta [Candidatus Aenigmarchaeota archaeon]|nr:methionine--tRNA ligase subunit beta [Candidatus Aenigmarchaeota archaeon]